MESVLPVFETSGLEEFEGEWVNMIGEVRKIARQILDTAETLPIQIFIRLKKGILARFTNNGVHQNGFQDLFSYTLRLNGSDGTVYLESNDGSKKGIQDAIKRLHILVPNPVPFPVLKNKNYPKVNEHFSLPLKTVPERAARAIEEGLDLIRRERASANGYYSAYERLFYLADSKGLELFHPATAIRFGTTITKGAGKGYFSFYHPDPKKLRVVSVVREAIKLAEEASLNEVSIEPGEYECIFSPRAFIELIEPLRPHFDERLYQGGKSVLSGSLGKRIFSETFTLTDDVSHPNQFGIPFDVDGAPKKKIVLVDRGVLKGLLGEGNSTRGVREHPVYPENLVAEPGRTHLNHLFERIERGIFINKLRYHTLVRESGLEITGLATAACLYIEKGRVLGRVPHLRYHGSLFSILRSLRGQTKEQLLLKDGEGGAALFPYFWVSKLRVV